MESDTFSFHSPTCFSWVTPGQRRTRRSQHRQSLTHTSFSIHMQVQFTYINCPFREIQAYLAHKKIRVKTEKSCIVAITEQLHTLISPLFFLLLFPVFLLPKTPFITAFLWLKYIFYLVFSWTADSAELFETGFRQSNKLSWLQKKTPSLLAFCCWQEACIKSAFHVVSVWIKPFTLALIVPCCVTLAVLLCSFFIVFYDCWQSKSCLCCLYCHVWRWLQCVCGRLSFQTSDLVV